MQMWLLLEQSHVYCIPIGVTSKKNKVDIPCGKTFLFYNMRLAKNVHLNN